jgi:hypothetical protein
LGVDLPTLEVDLPTLGMDLPTLLVHLVSSSSTHPYTLCVG